MTLPVTTPLPKFGHLLRMTDDRGTFEHARFAEPRPEHGYCTDDMARVLVVATREHLPTPEVRGLARLALRFLAEAQSPSGAVRNRMDVAGRWTDGPTVEDCWGRSIWALGTAAAHSDVPEVRRSAVEQFERAARQRSIHPRAMAFAALGAAELLMVSPGNRTATDLLRYYADAIPRPMDEPGWPWPEPRLTYANAVLAEARIATGVALERQGLLVDGLALLAWLVDDHTSGGHLSPTPTAGFGRGEERPAFDQQPIEVSSLADACARAAVIDDSTTWPDGVLKAAAWFMGVNDSQRVMWDQETGGGFDGLLVDEVNRNQGAESTLALISTLQHAQRFSIVPQ